MQPSHVFTFSINTHFTISVQCVVSEATPTVAVASEVTCMYYNQRFIRNELYSKILEKAYVSMVASGMTGWAGCLAEERDCISRAQHCRSKQ